MKNRLSAVEGIPRNCEEGVDGAKGKEERTWQWVRCGNAEHRMRPTVNVALRTLYYAPCASRQVRMGSLDGHLVLSNETSRRSGRREGDSCCVTVLLRYEVVEAEAESSAE